jgi:hypothetical protein
MVLWAVLFETFTSAVDVLAVNEFTMDAAGLGSASATLTLIVKLKNPFTASEDVGFHTIVPATGTVCGILNVSVIYESVDGKTSVMTTEAAGSEPTFVTARV